FQNIDVGKAGRNGRSNIKVEHPAAGELATGAAVGYPERPVTVGITAIECAKWADRGQGDAGIGIVRRQACSAAVGEDHLTEVVGTAIRGGIKQSHLSTG